MDAAEARSLDCVRLLLQHDGNPAARDSINGSALHRLVAGGFDQQIGVALVAAGCPLAGLNNFGEHASTCAAQKLDVFDIPEPGKRRLDVPVLDRQLDLAFSTARHRSSQVRVWWSLCKASSDA